MKAVVVDEAAQVERLKELAERLGFDIRMVRLDSPGGVCSIRGRRTILLGEGAPSSEQIAVLCEALADLDLENVYILPAVRRLIEDFRQTPAYLRHRRR